MAGRHVIRIVITMIATPYREGEFGTFYALEPLTLCPMDTTPIVPELFGDAERAYLNDYHRVVFEKPSPFFEGEMLEFLEKACAPI